MKHQEDAKAGHASGRPPDYVIMVAQLAGRNWSNGTSPAEAPGARATVPHEPEADPADRE